MNIYYVARRSLVTGHTAGDEYTLDVDTTTLAFSTKVDKVTQRAIGGAAETLYSRTDRQWSVTFEPLRGARLAALVEFLDSTERGEVFRMMLPGDTAPGSLCRRTDEGYSLNEFMPLGDVATRDYFQASCAVLEL